MTEKEFILRAIRIPYKRWGSSWNGVDCFGLVRLFYREVHGIKLPDIRTYRWWESWKRASKPESGDVLFMHLSEPHVAIYISGRILHALKKHGVRCDKYDTYWKKKTKSIWRLKR